MIFVENSYCDASLFKVLFSCLQLLTANNHIKLLVARHLMILNVDIVYSTIFIVHVVLI